MFDKNTYNSSEKYYEIRERFNLLKQKTNKIQQEIDYLKLQEQNEELQEKIHEKKEELDLFIKEKSRIFVYLNRHCFNGLCRYDASGGFNVPFGNYKQPYFPREEMEFFHEKSQKATFIVADFEEIMTKYIKKEDVVYCDPPYAPLEEQKTNFTTYSKGGFGDWEQRKLASLANYLKDNNIPVLISNHDTKDIRKYYQNSVITELQVQRNINRKGDERGKAKEVLALFQ